MSQRKMRVGLVLILGMPLIPARAQSADQKIQELEQKIDELDQRVKVADRNKELKDEEAASQAKNAASVTADTSGFNIKSNDGNFLLKVGADLQADNRAFMGDGAAAGAEDRKSTRLNSRHLGISYAVF